MIELLSEVPHANTKPINCLRHLQPSHALGCRPIKLGPIILRVETAAIYCLSIPSYELLVR